MRRLIMVIAALAVMGTTEISAQGFLKKLKQKAMSAIGNMGENAQDEYNTEETTTSLQSEEDMGISVPKGSDIIQKRRTATVDWDGAITPSSASTASQLMSELPALPSVEKMARSTMEERDAFYKKIAAVEIRAEQLMKNSAGCSDADMERLRKDWTNKVQNLFGLTQQEMAIMMDDNAPESKKKPIQDKITRNMLGMDPNSMDMEKFNNMSEKEQEAYIKSHPEFVQQMQQVAMNARNFNNKLQQMTGGINNYENKVGRLAQDYAKFIEREEEHSYGGIARKYETRLADIYKDICKQNDPATIDAMYDQADKLLYEYRTEAAREYRGSLQRQIEEIKKFTNEYIRLTRELVAKGDIPECALGRADLNAVITVGNLLQKAYDDPSDLMPNPVCTDVIYELPDNGWTFCPWECGYPLGRGASVESMNSGNDVSNSWPLLAEHTINDGNREFGLLDKGSFRTITEEELERYNKRADEQRKKPGTQKPAYGTYKSRSGKRTVEYSQSGELIINGMTSYGPIAFTAKADCLQWIIFDGGKIVKCTYKL